MTRYLVHGYYTDEPQVVIDVVDADTPEAAEAAAIAARGDSGYTCDGADPLEDQIAGLLRVRAMSAEDVARGLTANEYQNVEDDATIDEDAYAAACDERSYGDDTDDQREPIQ